MVLSAAVMFPASCGETAADVGGLMLAITSDGPLPVERLDLTVESGGKILRDAQYRVPEEATLPTTVAIASNGRDTGNGRFFIDLVDNPRFDHEYTVFAQVLNGIDTIDRILEGDVIERIEIIP